MKITRTNPFDFCEVEPNYPELFLKWTRQKEVAGNPFQSRTETKKFWDKIRSEQKWIKVVVDRDIKHGTKVLAKAGSTCWAYYVPARKNLGVMVPSNVSPARKKQIVAHAQREHYIVRVLESGRHPRPIYEGEVNHSNVRVEMNEARTNNRKGK